MRHIQFKKLTAIVLSVLAAYFAIGCCQQKPATDKITVACYYFPNYHTGDSRNTTYKGDGWAEWELVKAARPRFEGHQQPKVPAWGYTDEKDPKVMAQKIEAASSHGIDAFIFDWYYYDDGPFLNRCLDEGFLKAENTGKLKFGLMWANHDWQDIHPYTADTPRNNLYMGKVSPETYEKICDHIIANYFTKPNYWLIDGKAYFSIYDISQFMNSFGSIEATRQAMKMMNDKAIASGLKGVHWNIVTWGNPILPSETMPTMSFNELIKKLDFASSTSYVWIHHVYPANADQDYNQTRDEYFKYWDKANKEYGIPYYPNVTMGWDSSPRTNQSKKWERGYGYPYTGLLTNNTPENFENALRMTRDKMLADPQGSRIMNINCWNEWTEGSYLEPDTINGMAYLEAVKRVFVDKK